MKFLLVCSTVFLSCSLYAQVSHPDGSALPDCPSASKMLVTAQARNAGPETRKPTEPSATGQPTSAKQSPRVIDRSFFLVNLFPISAMFADVESEEYKISHGNGPGNSPYGTPPSRVSLYAIAVPVTAATVAWSYHLKRKYPHSKRYLLPPMILGSAYAIKAIATFASAK
jgi:hypothetical protein